MSEFTGLTDESNIYKLVGPILAKQDLVDCKEQVQQRINFIEKELTRLETNEKDQEAKIKEKTENIKKMQGDFQRVVMQAQKAAEAQGQ